MDVKEPGTLSVGLYQGVPGCSVLAKLVAEDGSLVTVAEAVGDDAWTLLDETILDLAPVEAQRVVIFTNNAEIAKALTPPFKAPIPTKWVKVAGVGKVGYGGNEHHWNVLRWLSGSCRSKAGFRAYQVREEALSNACSYYRANYSPAEGHALRAPAEEAQGGGTSDFGLFAPAGEANGRHDAAPVLVGQAGKSLQHSGGRARPWPAGPAEAGCAAVGGTGTGSDGRSRGGDGRVHRSLPVGVI